MRVAFAGTPEFAVPALAALLSQHRVVGVLTQPDRPRGRGLKLAASAVKQAAQARQLPLAQPKTLSTEAARAELIGWQPEVLVVVAYGLLLPPQVLALPRFGCINIHASLLPRWRGAAPIQRAILCGDAETGVTLVQMDAGLDTGPVLLQRKLPVLPTHTGGALHDDLAKLGAETLLETLAGLAAGSLSARPQPASGVTYAAKISKSEARIDWARDAPHIERQVRAFNPSPIAYTTLEGEVLRILGANVFGCSEGDHVDVGDKEAQQAAKSADPGTIVSIQDHSMVVQCGLGQLAVTQVQRPGRKPVGVHDYSHSTALAGRRLG